jgi:8-oxo-dGTP pyrophosphatase MutT (NUDIX family)
MYAPPEVAVFVVRDQDGYVLLLHRVPADGGYWHIVAGRIDDGEIPQEAAARELREETGLVADVVFVDEVIEYASAETLMPAGPDGGIAVVVTCFAANAPRSWEPIFNEEHDGHRWCPGREAANTLRWPGTAKALCSFADQGV